MESNYSALTEEIDTNPESPKFKLVIESRLLSTRMFLAKARLKIGQKKYLLLILC